MKKMLNLTALALGASIATVSAANATIMLPFAFSSNTSGDLDATGILDVVATGFPGLPRTDRDLRLRVRQRSRRTRGDHRPGWQPSDKAPATWTLGRKVAPPSTLAVTKYSTELLPGE